MHTSTHPIMLDSDLNNNNGGSDDIEVNKTNKEQTNQWREYPESN